MAQEPSPASEQRSERDPVNTKLMSWMYRQGARVPACSVTIDNLRFSKSEADAALSGIPTWSQFVAGEVMAPADMFTVTIAPTWDELSFGD